MPSTGFSDYLLAPYQKREEHKGEHEDGIPSLGLLRRTSSIGLFLYPLLLEPLRGEL